MNIKQIDNKNLYFISKKVLNVLNYTYLDEDEVLIGVGWEYFNKKIIENEYVEYDGIVYRWVEGGVIPSTNISKVFYYKHIYNLNKTDEDILLKLIDGSYICSVSHYINIKKENRKKKLKRILNENINK